MVRVQVLAIFPHPEPSEYGIYFDEHLAGDGAIVFDHACRMGLEGVILQAP